MKLSPTPSNSLTFQTKISPNFRNARNSRSIEPFCTQLQTSCTDINTNHHPQLKSCISVCEPTSGSQQNLGSLRQTIIRDYCAAEGAILIFIKSFKSEHSIICPQLKEPGQLTVKLNQLEHESFGIGISSDVTLSKFVKLFNEHSKTLKADYFCFNSSLRLALSTKYPLSKTSISFSVTKNITQIPEHPFAKALLLKFDQEATKWKPN